MASMSAVNKAIKKAYPELAIEAVRGKCYVYFDGSDGLNKIESLMVHPIATSTDDMVRMVLEQIRDTFGE
jgi:hypothetical protein